MLYSTGKELGEMDNTKVHLEHLFPPHYFTREEEELCQEPSRFIHADILLDGDTEINKADRVPAPWSFKLSWRRAKHTVSWVERNRRAK